MDHMSDMAGMTSTAASAAAATGMSGMDHSSMSDMMGGCQISMLWNWNTIDACFISSSWHITSNGMFAGSCIGVILLVVALEGLRRLRGSYNAHIRREFFAAHQRRQQQSSSSSSSNSSELNPLPGSEEGAFKTAEGAAAGSCSAKPVAPRGGGEGCAGSGGESSLQKQVKFRPTLVQHLVRSLLHTVQFGLAYFIMLLAMYYNGYLIICILIGAFLGHFAFFLGSDDTDSDATGCCD